jgi:hypothetical protein
VPLAPRLALVGLELFTAFGALYGGGLMIADPTGARIGFPPGLLERTPFGNYLIPGLVLLVVNGLGMLAGALALLLGWRHAVEAALALGALLSSWIVVQLLLVGSVSPLQPVMLVTGLLLLIIAWIARRAMASRPG